MENGRYSYDHARAESELVAMSGNDFLNQAGDTRLNTEHYAAGERVVEYLSKKYRSLENLADLVELRSEASALGQCYKIDKIIEGMSEFIESCPPTAEQGDVPFARLSAKQAVEQLLKDCENPSEELLALAEHFGTFMYNYVIAVTTKGSAEFTPLLSLEKSETILGLELHEMEWPGQARIYFELFKIDGEETEGGKLYNSAILEYKRRDSDEMVRVDLADYFKQDGKEILFTGMSSSGGANATSTEGKNNRHIIGIDQSKSADSFFSVLLAILHELGHVDLYGKKMDALVKGEEGIDELLGDEKQISSSFQMQKVVLDREISEIVARQNDIGAKQAIGNEYSDEEKLHILREARNVFDKEGVLGPEDMYKLCQYPELGKLYHIAHERRACRFAIKKMHELDPDVYDYAARVATAEKLYLNSRIKSIWDFYNENARRIGL